jgi:hypothetical protein
MAAMDIDFCATMAQSLLRFHREMISNSATARICGVVVMYRRGIVPCLFFAAEELNVPDLVLEDNHFPRARSFLQQELRYSTKLL